jgi:hypothetical protein
MEEEEPAPKGTLELVTWHTTRSLRKAVHFCMTQPVIALLLIVLLFYLVGINRKVTRLEQTLVELKQLIE